MSTIKFTRHDELDLLLAQIYLDTKQKLTKKDLLEIIFEVGIQDYQYLLKKILNQDNCADKGLRKEFIQAFSGSITLDDHEEMNPKTIWVKQIED